MSHPIGTHPSRALVLGASGGIGGHVARQLRDAGWQVVALQRGAEDNVVARDGITWLRGDALRRADVMHAARDCSVIVHAVNPPGYRHWAEQVLPMMDNTLAAAQKEGALVVLPGTVYNYGTAAFPVLTEHSPQSPHTRKGAIRVELERRMRVASETGARGLIVRAGDFFGPRAGNNWFSQGLVKPGQPVKTISVPNAAGVGHQWSYLPDVARTMVELIGRRATLPAFANVHMAGHWDADGTQMPEAIRRVVARHGGRAVARSFPWWLMRLASPFVPTLRELQEMRYLWRQPVRMGNARLLTILGTEPHTALDDAIEATLIDMRCLPGSPTTPGSPVPA